MYFSLTSLLFIHKFPNNTLLSYIHEKKILGDENRNFLIRPAYKIYNENDNFKNDRGIYMTKKKMAKVILWGILLSLPLWLLTILIVVTIWIIF